MNEISVEKIALTDRRSMQEEMAAAEINRSRLNEVCHEFEQIFIKYMVDKMWSSVEIADGDISRERTIYQDMLNGEMAKKMSENSNLGIAEMIYQQLNAAYFIEACEKP